MPRTADLRRLQEIARRPCVPERRSLPFVMPWLTVAPILKPEPTIEICRDRCARRLCCSHLGAYDRGVASHNLLAPCSGTIWSVPLRVASGTFRIRHLHYRAFIDGSLHRAL